MGYDTEFEGKFTLDRDLSPEQLDLLQRLANIRSDDPEFRELAQRLPRPLESAPPSSPSWLQWVPTGARTIEWDGNEKFYDYVEWLDFLIVSALSPWGLKLNGTVAYSGEDINDRGTITVVDNHITFRPAEDAEREAEARKQTINELTEMLEQVLGCDFLPRCVERDIRDRLKEMGLC